MWSINEVIFVTSFRVTPQWHACSLIITAAGTLHGTTFDYNSASK